MAPPNLMKIYQIVYATLDQKKAELPETSYSSNGVEETAEWNDSRYSVSISKRSDDTPRAFTPYKVRIRMEKKKGEWSESEKKQLKGMNWEGKKAYQFGY